MLRSLIAATLLVVAQASEAQVRVVESSPQSLGSGVVSQPVLDSAVENDVYSQIRSLQDEISTLRGMIEEQSYELKQLKQLQLDSYMDIDRRLSGATASTPAAADKANTPASVDSKMPAKTPAVTPAPSLADKADESALYSAAYDLLQQRQFEQSAVAFKDHLTQYPSGTYASNSYYWLGKIAMQKRDYEDAKNWFSDLIATFPASQKVPDAQLDLGRVHFFLGDKAKAQEILTPLSGQSSNAGQLARKFLSDNY
jgi:tol-pal system protein YbgF